MARTKKEDIKEEQSGDVSKNMLGSLLNGYKEDHYNFIHTEPVRISTGSLILDSMVQIRSGSVCRWCSPSELGKTSQCLLMAKNYMETMPKAKTLFIKSEGRLSKEMRDRSALTYCFDAESWSYNSVFVFECSVFETIATFIEKLLKTMFEQGEHLCIILDSLDGCLLKNDLQEKSIGDNVMVAGVPKMTKLLFKRLALPINKYNALLLMTSQVSANIQLNPYSKEPPKFVNGVGGASAVHSCDYIFEINSRYQKDLILEKPDEKPDPVKNKILGHWVRLDIKKSASNHSNYSCQYPVSRTKTGNCIWQELEVGDLLLAWSIIAKKGAWLTFSEEAIKEAKESGIELKEQIQGLNNLYAYLEENPEVFQYFYKKFSQMLG